MSKIFQTFVLLFSVLFFSCGGGSSKQVTVSWNANTDAVVNTNGGGYTLYYSQESGFDIADAYTLDIPYVSGATAPTSTILTLAEGDWFIRIAAYGVLNGASRSSEASDQIQISVGG